MLQRSDSIKTTPQMKTILRVETHKTASKGEHQVAQIIVMKFMISVEKIKLLNNGFLQKF